MKKEKHYHKKKALLEFHKDKDSFTTKQAVDFLNTYPSKMGTGLHRYTQTTVNQLGAILRSCKNYYQLEPNNSSGYMKSKDKTSVWKYIGEEE